MFERRSEVFIIAMSCIYCGIVLFVSSIRFVNSEVTPKWTGLMAAVAITGIAWSIMYRKISQPYRYIIVIFAAIALSTLALSIHGILQYTGALASKGGKFAVTGSFDNPAGYASALAIALPLCFLFLLSKECI